MPLFHITLDFRAPRTLTARERAEILALASTALDLDRNWFEARLDLHDEVVLYRARRTGALVGVTGLRLIDAEHEGRAVRVIYTSAVVLHPEWRGRGLVPWAGLRTIARHGSSATRALYWFMETDNWRAYALAASNTKVCWPRPAGEAPPALYDRLCATVLGGDWDATRRVCRPIAERLLRPEIARIPSDALAANPHARAYAALNPGYADGEALPVLVPLDGANLLHVVRGMWRRALAPRAERRVLRAAHAPL